MNPIVALVPVWLITSSWSSAGILLASPFEAYSFTLRHLILSMPQNFNYGIDKLTVGTAIALGSGKIKGILNDDATKKVNDSQQYVQHFS